MSWQEILQTVLFIPIAHWFCCEVHFLWSCLCSVTSIFLWDNYVLFSKKTEFMSLICSFLSSFCHHSCVGLNICWYSWLRHHCIKSQASEIANSFVIIIITCCYIPLCYVILCYAERLWYFQIMWRELGKWSEGSAITKPVLVNWVQLLYMHTMWYFLFIWRQTCFLQKSCFIQCAEGAGLSLWPSI